MGKERKDDGSQGGEGNRIGGGKGRSQGRQGNRIGGGKGRSQGGEGNRIGGGKDRFKKRELVPGNIEELQARIEQQSTEDIEPQDQVTSYGQQLRYELKLRGWTPEQLAEKIRVPMSHPEF